MYERYDPAIDSTYFPETGSTSYWTATEYAGDEYQAHEINFQYGASHQAQKEYRFYLRCVRGNNLPTSAFTDNGDGTITDETTDLMWQQDTGPKLLWEESKAYCIDLPLAGYEDWRMPTIRELFTLV